MSMYRLMLYYLIFLVLWAVALSFVQILPFNPPDIILGALFLVVVCWISNKLLAKVFKVSTNPESPIITGLILSLIIGPVNWIPAFLRFHSGQVAGMIENLLSMTAMAVFAMASKYILAFKKKHIFNPAAFGVVATALILGQGASWWVGNLPMSPFIIFGGLLMLKKIRRIELVGTFILATLVISFVIGFASDQSLYLPQLVNLLFQSPILFFSFVMLIEPLTSPLFKNLQIMYAAIVAVVFNVVPQLLPNIYYPLELSLLIGNIFSFIVSKNFREILTLKRKDQLTPDVITFQFEPTKKIDFQVGQFLQWSLPHPKPDSRGIRRFFTISSSPTEDFIMLTSKFYEKPSTFKQALKNLKTGDEIIVSDLAGEFTLPKDSDKKLCFIAGGIGITPFRSMVQWMIDNEEHKDVVLLYSNKTEQDIVFKDIFEKAKSLGLRTVYVNTEKQGYIDEKLIKKEVSDWRQRIFYVSGPEPMVQSFEKMLVGMDISKRNIKRDYFPGYTETHAK